jgi:uncharacterized protein YgiM (DUF1202 family)
MSDKGHLPSSDSPSDGNGGGRTPQPEESGRLPSREDHSDKAEGDKQPPLDESSAAPDTKDSASSAERAESRRKRIRRITAGGGMDELPPDFDDPDDGDWQVVRSENPFEQLYLDHEQYEDITSDMVQQHYELLYDFWKRKVEGVESGAGGVPRQIARLYGNGDKQAVRDRLEQTERAYGLLHDADGREACYQELSHTRVQQGREELEPLLAQSLRDGILEPSEAEGLFEAGREAGLQDEEVADFVKERLRADGFAPVGEPEGDTFAEHLRSVRWMTREKYRQWEDEREEKAPVPEEGAEEAPLAEATTADREGGKFARSPMPNSFLVGGGVLLVLGLIIGGVMLYGGEQQGASTDALSEPKFSVATTADRLNVHAEPSVQGETLAQVPKGTRLEVTGLRGNWRQVLVSADGRRQEGWIHAEYVERVGERENERTATNQTSETEQGQETSSSRDSESDSQGNSTIGEEASQGNSSSEEEASKNEASSAERSVPVEVFSMDGPDELTVGEEAAFSATANDDQVTASLSYRWEFGDGTTSEGFQATHSYREPGTYTVRFQASDDRTSDEISKTVKVEERSPTSISFNPEASTTAEMEGNRFTITVLSGEAVVQKGESTKLELNVQQKSENFDGKWVRWGHILDESYLDGPRGRAYDVDRSESENLGSGRVQPGDTRTGTVVFRMDVPPDELDRVRLNFTYFPYRDGQTVQIPFSIQ